MLLMKKNNRPPLLKKNNYHTHTGKKMKKARSQRVSRPSYMRGTKKIYPSKSQARRKFSREVKYPMYVLSVRKFIRLYSRSKFPKIETHAVLKSRGDLVMWQDVKGKIIFVSHEWAVRRGVRSSNSTTHFDTLRHKNKKNRDRIMRTHVVSKQESCVVFFNSSYKNHSVIRRWILIIECTTTIIDLPVARNGGRF